MCVWAPEGVIHCPPYTISIGCVFRPSFTQFHPVCTIVCLMVPTVQNTPQLGCSLHYGSLDGHFEIGSDPCVCVQAPKGVPYCLPCTISIGCVLCPDFTQFHLVCTIACLMDPTVQNTPHMGCNLHYGSLDGHFEIGSEPCNLMLTNGVGHTVPKLCTPSPWTTGPNRMGIAGYYTGVMDDSTGKSHQSLVHSVGLLQTQVAEA